MEKQDLSKELQQSLLQIEKDNSVLKPVLETILSDAKDEAQFKEQIRFTMSTIMKDARNIICHVCGF